MARIPANAAAPCLKLSSLSAGFIGEHNGPETRGK